MNKVLLVSYYFPPMGLGGTQRVVSFARYLQEFGWDVYVLTSGGVRYIAEDRTLDMPDVDVLRVKDPLGFRGGVGGGRMRFSWVREVFFPDPRVFWAVRALSSAVALVRREKIEVVLTSAPPLSVHLIGYALSRKGVRWVADFRDPVVGSYFEVGEPLREAFLRWFERKVVGVADASVAVVPGIAKEMEHRTGRQVFFLPNGYDDREFSQLECEASRDGFVFVWCGSVTPLRDIRILLRGFKKALQLDRNFREKARVRIIGKCLGVDVRDFVDMHNLSGYVEFVGYLPREVALCEMLRADALLFSLAFVEENRLVYTGRIFEYLKTKKPILGIMPDGELSILLRDFPQAVVILSEDENAIAEAFLSIFKGKVNQAREPVEYERRLLALKLADLLIQASG